MQLPMTDWTEIFRDCYWYTSGLIAWLWRSLKAYTLLKHKEIFVKQKFQLKVQIGKNFYSSFSAMIWVGRIFVSSHKFRTGGPNKLQNQQLTSSESEVGPVDSVRNVSPVDLF